MPDHTGQRHIGGGDGVHGTDDIALDAGYLHKARHRVADKPLQICERHGERLGALLGRAAPDVHQCGGSHCAGSADLRLTAALGTRQRGAGGHDLPEPGGNVKCAVYSGLICQPAPPQRQQHSGQNTAAARCRRSNDALHAGVALSGFQRLGHDIRKIAVCVKYAAGRSLADLGCIAACKAAHRAVCAAVAGAGGAHDRPEPVHLGLALGAGQAAFGQVAFQNDLIERLAGLFAELDHIPNGGKCHFACPLTNLI